jgi:hypothetical protein
MRIFTFQLTESQVQIIAQALGEIPFKLAKPVIDELQKQADAQQNPDEKKEEPE